MDASAGSSVVDEAILQQLRTETGESFVAVSRGFSKVNEICAEGWAVFSCLPRLNSNRFLLQSNSPDTLRRFEAYLELHQCASTALLAGDAKLLPLSQKWTRSSPAPLMMFDLTTLSEAQLDEMQDPRVYLAKEADYTRVVQCLIDSFDMDAEGVECSPFAYAARTIESLEDVKLFLVDNEQGEVASIVYAVSVAETSVLLAMGTVPKSRRKGLGRAILHASFIDARKQNLKRSVLFASTLGKLLYESVGFKILEEWEVYCYSA